LWRRSARRCGKGKSERTIMIFAGVWLIAQFHWLLYLFGAFLMVTGIKMWWAAEQHPDLTNNPVVRWIYKIPVLVSLGMVAGII
jgi:predicted tellurium resistance membrane protein TerC